MSGPPVTQSRVRSVIICWIFCPSAPQSPDLLTAKTEEDLVKNSIANFDNCSWDFSLFRVWRLQSRYIPTLEKHLQTMNMFCRRYLYNMFKAIQTSCLTNACTHEKYQESRWTVSLTWRQSMFATLKAGGWVYAARTLWLLHEEVPAKSASTALSCQFQVKQRWSNHFNEVVNRSIKGKRQRRHENVGCVSDDFKNSNYREHMSAICLHWHSIGYLMSAWIHYGWKGTRGQMLLKWWLLPFLHELHLLTTDCAFQLGPADREVPK